jgi:hypothetical protein
LQAVAIQAYHRCASVLVRGGRWLGTPSPGLRYLMVVLTIAIEAAGTALHKALHRLG